MEFNEASRSLSTVSVSAGATTPAWRLVVAASDNGAAEAFNRTHVALGQASGMAAQIDGLDVTVGSPDDVRRISDLTLSPLRVWFEVPTETELQNTLRAVVRMGNSATLNLGDHVTAVPPANIVATFLLAALRIGVFCKAKGLMRAARGGYTSALESGTPSLHGFVNLLLAATLARELLMKFLPDADILEAVASLLDEVDSERIVWKEDAVIWRDYTLGIHAIETARHWFARSVVPPSFVTAVNDLRELGLL